TVTRGAHHRVYNGAHGAYCLENAVHLAATTRRQAAHTHGTPSALHPGRFARLCAVSIALAAAPAIASNCSVTSVGFTPLIDLGTGTYQGQEGGLYPGGSNLRPSGHDAAGRFLAETLSPVNGKIVFISIGMSNTTAEFSHFVPQAMSYPFRNPALLVVVCAEG